MAQVPWAGATGTTGAGLGATAEQRGRVWGDLALFANDDLRVLSPMAGLGLALAPTLELEAVLPTSFASVEVSSGFSPTLGVETERESRFRVGAPLVGLSYVEEGQPLRFKVGGAIAYNPVEYDEFSGALAVAGGAATRGLWDPWLWTAETLSFVAPFRLEYFITPEVIFGLDAGLGLMIPTYEDGDPELPIQVAPGVGAWVAEQVLVGGRLALVWAPLEAEEAQLFLEPYARFHFGSGFFMTRFTINIDDPHGFAFEEGGVWGFHVGGGGVF